MSDTDTPEFQTYVSIIIGYSLNIDKLLKLVKRLSFDSEIKEYDIHNVCYLSKINEILFRDTEIKIFFNGEKALIGVQLLECEKDTEGFSLNIFKDYSIYEKRINDTIYKNKELVSLIRDEFKIHLMIYD
jgi:hypothetical protein